MKYAGVYISLDRRASIIASSLYFHAEHKNTETLIFFLLHCTALTLDESVRWLALCIAFEWVGVGVCAGNQLLA